MILPFPQTDKNLVALLSTKEEDFSSLLVKLKLPDNQIVGMWQKHTDHVRWVEKKDRGVRFADTDALIAAETGVFLTVRVADCVPVLYFDPKSKIVALAHCGWRGIRRGLAAKVVEEMSCKGIDQKELLIVLGPAARVCCYEIGKDLVELFQKQFGPAVIEKRQGKTFLNMQKCLQIQLKKAGVLQTQIFDANVCTVHNNDQFHSYRADKRKENNVALIGYRG